jgi:hypothetical protein
MGKPMDSDLPKEILKVMRKDWHLGKGWLMVKRWGRPTAMQKGSDLPTVIRSAKLKAMRWERVKC